MVYTVRPRPLLQTIPFVESKKKEIVGGLPQENLLRQVRMMVKIVLTTDAAKVAGNGINPDGLSNIIKALRLKLGANDAQIDIDGWSSKVSTEIETGTPVFEDTITIPAAGSSTTLFLMLYMDFARFRQVLLDRSALFDNLSPSSTNIEITWGAISDLITTPNDTYVNSSSEVTIELFEAFDTDSGAQDALLKEERIDFKESIERQLIDKAYSSFNKDTFQFDALPAPAVIDQVLFTSRLDTEVRSDDIVTAVKLDNTQNVGFNIAEWNDFDTIHRSNKTEYGLETLKTGVAYIDLTDIIDGGFQNLKKETNKWRMLTVAPSAGKKNILDIWARYI